MITKQNYNNTLLFKKNCLGIKYKINVWTGYRTNVQLCNITNSIQLSKPVTNHLKKNILHKYDYKENTQWLQRKTSMKTKFIKKKCKTKKIYLESSFCYNIDDYPKDTCLTLTSSCHKHVSLFPQRRGD